MQRIMTALMLVLAVCTAQLAYADMVPQSVRLFAQQAQKLPQSNFDLNLCTLLARAQQFPGGFWAVPADRTGPLTCDLSHVLLAYDGWCAAGVCNIDPHFSQALMAWIEVDVFEDGIVIWANHYTKKDVPRTPACEAAAVAFLHGPLKGPFKIGGASLELFPQDWLSCIPMTAGCDPR